MAAILYFRYSPRPSLDPGEEDPNIKQRRLVLADSEKRGLEIRAEFADAAKSGADRKRPQLAEALKRLKRGDELVVFDWKRLARDLFKLLSIAEEVKAKRCRLYSVAHGYFSDDADMMRFAMSAMLGLFAQMERKDFAERTSRVMRRRQADGDRMSKIPPYGQRLDPDDPAQLIGDDDEQRIIMGILIDSREFGLGPRAIARKLTAANIPCRWRARRGSKGVDNGNGWHHSTVKAILRRAESQSIAGGNGGASSSNLGSM